MFTASRRLTGENEGAGDTGNGRVVRVDHGGRTAERGNEEGTMIRPVEEARRSLENLATRYAKRELSRFQGGRQRHFRVPVRSPRSLCCSLSSFYLSFSLFLSRLSVSLSSPVQPLDVNSSPRLLSDARARRTDGRGLFSQAAEGGG